MFDGAVEVDRIFRFGPFSLSPRKRLLLDNGKPVRLGSRALEILIMLTERGGELVAKDELIARVWPTTVVVEANLTAQMTRLRRALRDGHGGNRYILNEPGRGYRMVATVAVAGEPHLAGPLPAQSVSPDEVSAAVLRLVEFCCVMEAMRQSAVASAAEGESPDARKAIINGILQRGIWALEFAHAVLAGSADDLFKIAR
jgi:DNA-binding winged helix-turn-helix (wHTH) protein